MFDAGRRDHEPQLPLDFDKMDVSSAEFVVVGDAYYELQTW